MPDWREAIDPRLADLGVPPLRRVEILEETTGYLLDRYEELRSGGHSRADARRLALADLETDTLARALELTELRAPHDWPPLGARRSTRRDPTTFAAIAAVLAAVGSLASVVPARRATRVDPIVALRES